MTDVKSKKCLHSGCEKIPSYNLAEEKEPLYCLTHKSGDMVNVKIKKCLHVNCQKQATYGPLFQKKIIV